MTATRARRVTRSFGWTTTPGRLRLAALTLALAAATFGLLVATTVDRHRDAARAVAMETEPLLVAAAELHVALSDADATAVTTFVTGGQEPPERRRRYLADVAAATTALTTLSRSVDPSRETGGAVLTIARELPVYTGLIETARANSHQGHPVGAAYLRQASGVMRERILPAAVRLYAVEARRLNRSSREGAASRGLVTVAVAAGGLLVLLVLAQVYLARLSQRVFNVPLVTASILLVVLAGWALTALAAEQPCARARSTRRLEPGPGAVGRTRARLARAGRRRSRPRRARRRRRQPGRLRCDAEAARRRARRVRPAQRGDSTGRDTGHSTTRCSGCATASRTTDGSTTAW